MLVSFIARALSTYRRDVFCFTAISSSAVIGMLPGYLIRTPFSLCLPLHEISLNWVYSSNQFSGVGIQEYYEREYKDDLCFDFYPLFSMIHYLSIRHYLRRS